MFAPTWTAYGALVAAVTMAIAAGTEQPGWSEEWRVIRKIRTRSMPWSVTVASNGAHLYVAHVGLRGRDNVYRYDTATFELVARARFSGHAVESVVRGDSLFVSNSRKHRVIELEANKLAVRRQLESGAVPKQIALSPDGKTLYTANWKSGSVSVIELATGRAEHVKTGRHTRGVTVSRDGSTVYAAVFGARQVAVIDAAKRAVSDRIDTCKHPRHVVVTHDDKHLLVSCFGDRYILIIDRANHAMIRRVRVGRGPKTIALSPDGTFAVTADERADSLSIIDLATWRARSIPIPAQKPCGAAVSPDSRRIYLTARGSDELVVLERGAASPP
ncbi:MAG: beta-propeller fold lactonase family protein [Proteobacteria bacterium]|nr:beta-propeller fold lactonase family protein [Pseudomonadota bacterium]